MKINVIVWDKENYTNLSEAIEERAISRYEVEGFNEEELSLIRKGVEIGIQLAGQRLCNDSGRVGLSFTQLYSIDAQVLEWNTYSLCIEAESKEAAIKYVQETHPVQVPMEMRSDVEFGTDSFSCSFPFMSDFKILTK